MMGPRPPPGFSSPVMIGPQIPEQCDVVPNDQKPSSTDEGICHKPATYDQNKSAHRYGPMLPPGFEQSQSACGESDDEDDVIGPRIGEIKTKGAVSITEQLEKRAQEMQAKLMESHDAGKLKREEWMTELPPALSKNIGLGLSARSFRKREAQHGGDRSEWTDTPADRERKLQEGSTSSKRIHDDDLDVFTRERNEQFKNMIDKHNRESRKESLLETHIKKRKKEKKREEKKEKKKHKKGMKEEKTRRPFDRDVDLKVNQFDEAQRKALIHKSRDLNTRFNQGKYL